MERNRLSLVSPELILHYFKRYRVVTTTIYSALVPSGASFEQWPLALEELDHGIQDGTHTRQRPEVAMDQKPLVGEDVGDHAADALQLGVKVAEIARQDGQPCT